MVICLNYCCDEDKIKAICKELYLKKSFKFCRNVDHIVDSDICVKSLRYKIIMCDDKYKLLVQGFVCIKIKYCSDACYSKIICEERSLPFATLIAIPPCSKIKDINICINKCKIYRCDCRELLFKFILGIDVIILVKDTRPKVSANLACFCNNEACSLCNNIDFRDDFYPY